MNDLIKESVQQTPFFANYGWHPHSGDFLSALPIDNHPVFDLAIPGYPGWSGREKYFRWCGTR